MSWLGLGSGSFKNVPQFFRFNKHFDLEVQFEEKTLIEKIDDLLAAEEGVVPKRKSLRTPDSYFSHLFKELKSEYLIDGDDGNFVKMECSTWLDISAEAASSSQDSSGWKTDLSLVNLKDARSVPYLTALTDS